MADLIAEFKAASAIVAVVFFGAVTALRADIITVTNRDDSGPGSLRQGWLMRMTVTRLSSQSPARSA